MRFSIFDLVSYNPWWSNIDSIHKDMHIHEFYNSTVQWIPRIQQYMPLDGEDYIFYTIRGPRQVGKTTFIKQLILRLLIDEKIPPNYIFFYPCDQIQNERDLTGLVETFIDHARKETDKRLYIFLDEITSVDNWQNSIKLLFDSGKLKTTTLIINGSHALDIHKGSGELAGRTGKENTDNHKMFVPMKFAEFVSCVDGESWNRIKKSGFEHGKDRRKILLDIMFKKSDKIPYDLILLKKDLDILLEKYCICGGVPRAINDLVTKKVIPSHTFDDYIDALRGDLGHWKKDTWIAKELLTRLIRSTSFVSWNEIGKDMGTTQPTIKDYVWTLEQCFTLTYIHQTDNPVKPKPNLNQGKKVYFEDPFIMHAIRYWVSANKTDSPFDFTTSYLSSQTNLGHVIENIIANHLIRLQFNMNPHSGFQYNRDLFCYKPDKRTEIDFLFNSKEGVIPIESKYQSSISTRDSDPIVRAASKDIRGILISKDDISVEDRLSVIPASLFLLLI